MNSHDLLKNEIKAKAVVHGKVILSSGKEADYYVDLRRVTLDSTAAPLIGELMLDLLQGWEFDAVGGLTLGADPVATAIMHSTRGRRITSGTSNRPRLRPTRTLSWTRRRLRPPRWQRSRVRPSAPRTP